MKIKSQNIAYHDISEKEYRALPIMSYSRLKSKGNVISPQEVMEKYSADNLRFWAASSKLGEDLDYQEDFHADEAVGFVDYNEDGPYND
jgi:cysteinyl-tRNA synthetase